MQVWEIFSHLEGIKKNQCVSCMIKKSKYSILVCSLFIVMSIFAIQRVQAAYYGKAVVWEAKTDLGFIGLQYGFGLDVAVMGSTAWSDVIGGYYFKSTSYYFEAHETPWPQYMWVGKYLWVKYSDTVSYFYYGSLKLWIKYTVTGRFYRETNPSGDYCDVTIWIKLYPDGTYQYDVNYNPFLYEQKYWRFSEWIEG